MSNQVIQQLEQEQLESLNKDIPAFRAGDTVVVQVKIKEGNRTRLQAFEGLVIAKRNRGLNSAFTVRKISNGEGVERVFPTYSPNVAEIKVKRRGRVRRAKLYYFRELRGKAARIREDLRKRAEDKKATKGNTATNKPTTAKKAAKSDTEAGKPESS